MSKSFGMCKFVLVLFVSENSNKQNKMANGSLSINERFKGKYQ